MRGLRRVVAVVVGLAVGTVLLPIAINYATSQPLPTWLEPYRDWAWPAVAVLGGLAVALGLTGTRSPKPRQASSGKSRPGSRERALDNIATHLTDQLTLKLGDLARADLRTESRPDAVAPVLSNQVRSLTPDTPPTTVRQAFDASGSSLLLLGRPGAGKTTQLLELATDLLGQAREHAGPVPVLIELGGWGREQPLLPFLRKERTVDTLREWLLARAQETYGVGSRISGAWLAEGGLALLLDGLDEVADQVRPELVGLINELCDAHGDLVIVVAGRTAEYERCPRLQLAGAATILPLSREQVTAYLGHELDDETLWEVIDSPFWLHVLTSLSDVPAAGVPVAERRRRILDAYVAKALGRPGPELGRYPPEQVMRWLGQFARCARHLGWTTVVSPQSMPSIFKGTVPAGFLAPILPVLCVALPGAVLLHATAALAPGFGALSTVGLAWLPVVVVATFVSMWVVGGDVRWPFSRRTWVVGSLAVLPLSAAGYGLQALMGDPPLFPGSPDFSLALLVGFSASFVPGVVLGVLEALLGLDADPSDAAIRLSMRIGLLCACVVAVVCLPLAVFGAVPWTGPFPAGFAGLWIGVAVSGGIGLMVGAGAIGTWLPAFVLVAAGLLPLRANRFCRYAAATGLFIPAGYGRPAYRFPHMIFVDHFIARGVAAD
ncbi:MAG: hypothetical protein HOY71_31610 [Nonomuraea sp.]|nr:hypothetical protein [Nonomuraea sp.]